MKILFICDYYDDSQLYQEPLLSKYYKYLGHEVYVITSLHKDVFNYVSDLSVKNSQILREKGINEEIIIRMPYVVNIKNKIKKFENIQPYLKEIEPDLIFFHDISFNTHDVINWLLQAKTQCKIIMDYHADYSNSANNWMSLYVLHKIIRKRYLKRYIKYFHKVYPIVPEGKRFLSEIYGISDSKMELLPLGVDSFTISELKKKETIRSEIRKKYNIPEEDILIVTGGKLEPQKRTELAIKAIDGIHNNIHLLIFGKSFSTEYQNELEAMGMNKNIHFTGWLSASEILEVLLCGDIAVFPSSQSVLWQQAIGAGLPLIVGDSGGQNADYMNLYNNIIVVSKNNIRTEYFRELLLHLINNPDILDAMKEGALKTTNELLDYKIIAQKTLS